MTTDALTVQQVCERALQRIGAYSVNDSAARPRELARAAEWLDMHVQHLVGTNRCTWLIQRDLSFTLSDATPGYSLADALGASFPSQGIMFVAYANCSYAGRDWPLDRLIEAQYEAIEDKDAGGAPDRIYVDHLRKPSAYVWPVPTENASDYTIKLAVQTFNPTLSIGGSPVEPNKLVELRRSWGLYLVLATAAEIGAGPVRMLPDGEIDKLQKRADMLLRDLTGYENQEQGGDSRRIAFHDF